MGICHTVLVCPFSLDRLTGTPIRVRTTLRALSSQMPVSVIATQYSHPIPSLTVHTLGECSLFSFTKHSLTLLRIIRPTVVHGVTTASIVPLLLFKLFFSPRVVLIFEMHGWAWLELGKVHRPIVRTLFCLLDYIGLWSVQRVIAVSDAERRFLSRRTWKSHRVVTVWDPVDFGAPYVPPTRSENLVVGYIGNAAWWQGLHHIIGAATLLAGERNITFQLAGFDSSDHSQFPQLPSITYLGRVERDQVLSFLRGCDVLVSPRVTEGVSDLQFPHKLSEYLAAGRPVIVSSASDQPLVIKQAQCGTVVDPLDAENISQAIITLAKCSYAERDVMGRRALKFADENLSLPVLTQKLMRIYSPLS